MKLYNKVAFSIVAIAFTACQSNNEPQPINYGKDQCDHCQMTITDNKYGAELITSKGRVYKFDDITCLEGYNEEHSDKTKGSKHYVSDFESHELIPVEKATFIYGGELRSPMGGNRAAFLDKTKATKIAEKLGASSEPQQSSTEDHHHNEGGEENPHSMHNH